MSVERGAEEDIVKTVLPVYGVKLGHLEANINDLHEIIYKDGFITRITVLETQVIDINKSIMKLTTNLGKGLWLLGGLVAAFLFDIVAKYIGM